MTYPALSILGRARRLGVAVENRGGRLWAGPAAKLTPDLRTDLRIHRVAILAVLAGRDGHAPSEADPAAIGDGLDLSDGWQRRYRLPPGAWIDGDGLVCVPMDAVTAAIIDGTADLWRPSRPVASVPGTPSGWMADSWVSRLRALAAACEDANPGRARELRSMARREET